MYGDFFKTEMAELKEWVFEKFCFPLGKNAAETITVLKKALKDETTGKTEETVTKQIYLNVLKRLHENL